MKPINGLARLKHLFVRNGAETNDELYFETQKVQMEIEERVKYCLENEKPYLDPDITLEKFCRMVLSNTTTVSKVINKSFGMNFRRLLNRYRAEYAYALLVEDPCRNLDEVRRLSGFRSPETFKVSFLLRYGIEPKECRVKLRFPDFKPLSK